MLKSIFIGASALAIAGFALPLAAAAPASAADRVVVYGSEAPVYMRHRHDENYLIWPLIGYSTDTYEPEYAPPEAYAYDDAHVSWCSAHYATYDPASDTYMGYDGYRHLCPAGF